MYFGLNNFEKVILEVEKEEWINKWMSSNVFGSFFDDLDYRNRIEIYLFVKLIIIEI